ncbi:MAG: DUF58 domain-containing protein [Spirochaetota bacterium]|nr:DUF58 domain-containing protein [Spirochaetota bacterium]
MKVNYLDEELLQKLSQIPNKPLSLAEGIYKGQHHSRKSGEEVEFREFRTYIRGDDFKKVDWKRSARQDKLYIREFEEELNYKVVLLLDHSGSMGQPMSNGLSKLEYGKYVISALTYLFLKQGDQVQVSGFSDGVRVIFGFNNNNKQLSLLNDGLNNLVSDGVSQFSLLMDILQGFRNERLVLMAVSDFVSEESHLLSVLDKIRMPKCRQVLIHLQNEEDKTFPFKGEIDFIDPETGESFYCNASEVRDRFIAQWQGYLDRVAHWGRSVNVEFRTFDTDIHYSENLLNFIKSYHIKI